MDKLFGEFLVEKNIISRESLIEALNIQLKNRVPIGQLAINQGVISSEGMLQVLEALRKPENSRKRFGEVAVELKILTPAQVDKLLAAQSENSQPIGEILVSQEKLARRQQITLLKEFYAQKGTVK